MMESAAFVVRVNLKRKTRMYSEKLVLICHTTCRYIPEDVFHILILTTLRVVGRVA